MSFLAAYELNKYTVYVESVPWFIKDVHGIALLLPEQLLKTLSDREILNTIHWFLEHAREIEDDCTDSPENSYNDNAQPPKARDRSGWVYILRAGPYYKIGQSKNVAKRIKQISPKMPFKVSLLYKIYTADRYALEDKLHARYEEYRVNGEWFKLPQRALDELRILAQASSKEAFLV